MSVLFPARQVGLWLGSAAALGAAWLIGGSPSWYSAAAAALYLLLSFCTLLGPRLLGIVIPGAVWLPVNVFFFCTLVLGEIAGFYERVWWWDILMHGISAMGLGLAGAVLMLVLAGSKKLSAAPVTLSLFSFCFSLSAGAVWEIIEFVIDMYLGLNMQNGSLLDTMLDLLIDALGAAAGAAVVFLQCRGRGTAGLVSWVERFIQSNQRLFGR